ncbi:MAG: tyrosine decarboxylase [Bifidobacteriaceae bacterium]|nr:tyrosine decarboxylase [Bifidobacteriaceae bacterium]
MTHEEWNIDALFIGDKAENGDFFKKMTNRLTDEHLGWRQNYMPQDLPLVSAREKDRPDYRAAQDRVADVLSELSTKMRAKSVPWHSPRYWGHMNSETLMPAILAYNYAVLWNSNNVSYEGGPATCLLEEEVGHDLAGLFSFGNGWGHITADGSLANLEGLWYARNIKSLPLAMKEVKPELVEGLSDWQLLNMSVSRIMDLFSQCSNEEKNAIKAKSARGGGNLKKLGKWLVPQTKHYSWLKAADIAGIGLDQVVSVPVDDHYRMKIDDLERIIRDLAAQKTPILGVVAVAGTTEEGAVDHVDGVAALRNRLEKEGISFYFHVDAAYGGYARSLVLDEEGQVIPYEDLQRVHREYGVFQEDVEYLSQDVYRAFVAINQADSVTVDPHKMGYVPYAAGGIAIRDIRMRDVISYFASYVMDRTADVPTMLGSYVLGGSKAGATAAAVWTCHRILPLNVSGYGRLIGRAIEAAHRFYDFLNGLSFDINGVRVVAHTLTNPDFNMVDWVFVPEDMTSLKDINAFNHVFFDQTSVYTDESIYSKEMLTSHTELSIPDYGDSPLGFVESFGMDKSQWLEAGKVTVLRACVLTPFLYDRERFNIYADKIKEAIELYLCRALATVGK